MLPSERSRADGLSMVKSEAVSKYKIEISQAVANVPRTGSNLDAVLLGEAHQFRA